MSPPTSACGIQTDSTTIAIPCQGAQPGPGGSCPAGYVLRGTDLITFVASSWIGDVGDFAFMSDAVGCGAGQLHIYWCEGQ
jgi:hypothetical protein